MTKLTLTDHVKGFTTFSFYRNNVLFYVTDTNLEYPIHISDIEGATLLNKDKAIYHMRWIKKHLDSLK